MPKTTMHAFVTRCLRSPVIAKVPKPQPSEGQVLVRVRAVALNPTDYKHAGVSVSLKNNIVGCDFAGEVESWGPGVEGFAIGDRVGGVVHGCMSPTSGACAEFALTKGCLVWKVPDSISFEEASTLGVGICSGAYALEKLGWQVPGGEKKTEGASKPLLLYSAATATGLGTLQLANLLRPASSSSSAEIIALASPSHHILLKSSGATTTLPYNPLPSPSAVQELAPDLDQAVDLYSEGQSTTECMSLLGDAGGTIIRTLPAFGFKAREGVIVDRILAYFATGDDFSFLGGLMSFKADPYLHGIAVETLKALSGWVRDGKVKPLPFEVIPGGLAGLTEGYRRLKAGEVKGRKLVVSIEKGCLMQNWLRRA